MSAGESLKIEVRAIYPTHPKWFTMGLWATDPAKHPRESVRGQPGRRRHSGYRHVRAESSQPERVQLRVTLGGGKNPAKLKFLSLSLLDRKATPPPLPPNRAAWGKSIDVPERSQMAYENGGVICSPTTVSMLLAYWSRQLDRPGSGPRRAGNREGRFRSAMGGHGQLGFQHGLRRLI